MKRLFVPIGAALLLLAGQASAQMTRPTFGPDLAKLSFLVGNYATKTDIMMGGNSTSGTGVLKAHWGLDSMFVLIWSSENSSQMGTFKSMGILGYDADNSKYDLTMFSNFGRSQKYEGNFVGDTLVMKGTVEGPQGSIKQEYKWFKEGSNVRQLIYMDFGGQGYTLMVDQTATPAADGGNDGMGK